MALTIVITRGHTFVDGVPLTIADLNAAALPAIGLSGAVGSADLALGIINSTHITPGPIGYVLATGSANAFVVNPSPAATSLVAGLWVCFRANHTITGATTVNVNGFGAKSLKKLNDQALAAGDIVSGQLVWVQYDGTDFQLVSTPTGPRALYAAATGIVNVFAITLPGYVFNAYADLLGLQIAFKTNLANTLACTLDVNGKGPIAIKKLDGSDPAAADLPLGAVVVVAYNGSTFQLIGNYGVALLATAGTAGTYAYPTSIVTDVYGRVVNVAAGSPPTGGVRAWGSFTPSAGLSTKTGGAGVASTDRITVTAHGWSSSQLVWLGSGESYVGPADSVPYWVQVMDANTVKLFLDSGLTVAVDVTADGGSGTFYFWTTNPIVASSNVAGIVSLLVGQYDVYFVTPIGSANFAVTVNASSNPSVDTFDYLIDSAIVKNKGSTRFRIEAYDRHDGILRATTQVDFAVFT